MKKLGILVSISFAFLGFVSTCSPGAKDDINPHIGINIKNKNSHKNQNELLNLRKPSEFINHKVKRKNFTKDYYNLGIPPKIYGMNFVKRGTHKRNNR